jgi:hypothetical protein
MVKLSIEKDAKPALPMENTMVYLDGLDQDIG